MTFALGAFVLVSASLFLWLEGARLKQVVLGPKTALTRRNEKSYEAINDGVFAAWYNQPIFSAILSARGSLWKSQRRRTANTAVFCLLGRNCL